MARRTQLTFPIDKRSALLGLLLFVMLALCLSTFIFIGQGGAMDWRSLGLHLIINIPAFSLMFLADITILARLKTTAAVRISLALIITPVAVASLAYILFRDFDFVQSLLPMALCNSMVVLILGLSVSMKRQTTAAIRLAESEREKANYQFEVLKNQINPHFFFNSLNVLSALIYTDPPKADRFIKQLAVIYRYVLTTRERRTVCLAEEMQFLDSYIFLQEIRYGTAIRFEIDSCDRFLNRLIIPMSLQLLIENAVKHNVVSESSPLTIRIAVNDEGVSVSNNLQPRTISTPCGVGLENLRRQHLMHCREIKVIRSNESYRVDIPFIG